MLTNEDILNVISGDADETLKQRVYDQVLADHVFAAEFYRMKNEFALLATSKQFDSSNLHANLKQMEHRIRESQQSSRRKRMVNFLGYAAAVVLIVGMGTTLYQLLSDKSEPVITKTVVSTANGQQSTVVLPDNSRVDLSYGTRLEYDNGFGVSNRKLKLSGQALFDITKNESLPLQLQTSGVTIEVKGTRFDVNAYPEDPTIIIALFTGTVELTGTTSTTRYAMKPGEVVVYNRNKKEFESEITDLHTISQWRNGIFSFEKSNMLDVLRKLERKYNIKVRLKDTGILKSAFTATIKNEDFKDLFKQIEFACSVKCNIEMTPDSSTIATVYIQSR
jgi:transmembrane sensor